MVMDLKGYQQNCVEAFRMERSKEDIKTNPEAKKLARYINRMGRKIDRIERMKQRVFK